MNRAQFDQDFNRLREAYNTPVQDAGEFWSLVELVAANNTQNVLEIGVENGGTLWFWDKIVGTSGKIVAADTRNNIQFDMEECVSEVIFIEGDSHSAGAIAEIKAHFLDNAVDFLFIDGDHSYDGVKADFENFASLVRPGGIIAFHDISNGRMPPDDRSIEDLIGPHRLWIEMASGYNTTVYHNTIGIGVIRKENN